MISSIIYKVNSFKWTLSNAINKRGYYVWETNRMICLGKKRRIQTFVIKIMFQVNIAIRIQLTNSYIIISLDEICFSLFFPTNLVIEFKLLTISLSSERPKAKYSPLFMPLVEMEKSVESKLYFQVILIGSSS